MLSSIHPLGERSKGNSFALTATAFVTGAALGGATTGALSAVIGALVDLSEPASLRALLLVLVVGVLAEWRGLTLPSLRRQVNEDWLQEYRGWIYGLGFGFQLGAGLLTYVTSAAVFVMVVAAVVAPHPVAALGTCTVFGLARGLSILAVRHIDSPQALVAFHRRLHATARRVQLGATSALGLGALVTAAALV